jgi:hypothetical protein
MENVSLNDDSRYNSFAPRTMVPPRNVISCQNNNCNIPQTMGTINTPLNKRSLRTDCACNICVIKTKNSPQKQTAKQTENFVHTSPVFRNTIHPSIAANACPGLVKSAIAPNNMDDRDSERWLRAISECCVFNCNVLKVQIKNRFSPSSTKSATTRLP